MTFVDIYSCVTPIDWDNFEKTRCNWVIHFSRSTIIDFTWSHPSSKYLSVKWLVNARHALVYCQRVQNTEALIWRDSIVLSLLQIMHENQWERARFPSLILPSKHIADEQWNWHKLMAALRSEIKNIPSYIYWTVFASFRLETNALIKILISYC